MRNKKEINSVFKFSDPESFINFVKPENIEDKLSVVLDWHKEISLLNNNIEWWCTNCSSRNPLSSPLLYDLLAYLAVKEKIKTSNFYNVPLLYKAALNKEYNHTKSLHSMIYKLQYFMMLIYTFLKCSYQVVSLGLPFIKLKNELHDVKCDVALFTYFDGKNRINGDPYLGRLKDYLILLGNGKSIKDLAYICKPIRKNLNEAECINDNNGLILQASLSIKDYIWVWFKALKILTYNPNNILSGHNRRQSGFALILNHTRKKELAKGGIENLLVYRAAMKLAKNKNFSRIIYPFENKAVERCFLLGLSIFPGIETVGYQHASISKRHFSYHLGAEEYSKTPMPDKIITTGTITTKWLVEKCNFPAKVVKTGFFTKPLIMSPLKKEAFTLHDARLLFVVSSSVYELSEIAEFIREVNVYNPSLNLALRTHPTLPLELLKPELKLWVSKNIAVMNNDLLNSCFEWADVVIYISSTVALESLAHGIPVIRLNLDILNSDPLLGTPPYTWEASTPEELELVLNEIVSITDEDKNKDLVLASDYVNDYFRAGSTQDAEVFLA